MASPPTGTVTFLFTDIEGSTKLWEHDAPAMQVALARHNELLRSVIEERGGYVFKTVGDAAVFIRLRRAIGVERQQIKWFAYAAVATVSATILAYIIPEDVGVKTEFR